MLRAERGEAKARIAELEAENKELLEGLEKLVDAMVRYEMDVDSDATPKHRKMMKDAKALIAKYRGEQP